MKKRLFIMAFVLSVALNLGFLGAIGWHHWQRYDRIGCKHGFRPFYEKRFGLSKEKATKMEGLRRSLMQKMKPINHELAGERKELISLLSEPEVRKKEIDRRLNNIQTLQGKIQLMIVEHLLSAKENLIPQEQKRFFKFIMERMDSPHPPCPRMRLRMKPIMERERR
ncbi:periplasmic heavy metal sensor [bacterium]|nr:periplasmic heavy metal sensor [bacterium]